MVRPLLDSPLYPLLLGALCGVVGFRMGWRSGHRVGLPVLQSLLGYLGFAGLWRAAGARGAVVVLFGWALATTFVSVPAFRRDRERTDRQVWRAREYRASMLRWLGSGRLPEGRPLATCGKHLLEVALYVVAAAATANFLALAMGTLLLNYMNAYVARLLAAAREAWIVRLLAWNAWSAVRVAAYLMLGAAAGAPLAARVGFPADPAEVQALAVLGGAGVVVDLALKLALARPYGLRLARAVDLDDLARGTEPRML